MRREEIMKALKEAGTPITIEDLAERVKADIVPLRIDLYRLASEGKVERERRGNRTLWGIRVVRQTQRLTGGKGVPP